MIKKIKWNNHAILGSLELDFTKADGSVYNTIILAGENGTGKTTVLETLANFLDGKSFEPFEYIEYTIPIGEYQIKQTNNAQQASSGYHLRKNLNNTNSPWQEIIKGKSHPSPALDFLQDREDIRSYGFAYSKARSGFKASAIKTTTTLQLDSEKFTSDSKDDFTDIKQLLVDLSAQDNASIAKIAKIQKVSYEEFAPQSKIQRFRKAFNDFLDNIQFLEVDEESAAEKEIIFTKNGNRIKIDDLSTGEKQIVYRGALLLRNSRAINNGIALIDEPELSMHPQWQQKVLNYYRKLFTSNSGQSVQTIIATHSEYVLRSALEDQENVLIVVLTSNNGVIEQKRITAPTNLPTITAAETNYLAFDIVSPDYHIQLYGHLQNITGNFYVTECDDYIARQTTIYDPAIHAKNYTYTDRSGNIKSYQTLPTYIRNSIDHPDPTHNYTLQELRTSIELLINLCRHAT